MNRATIKHEREEGMKSFKGYFAVPVPKQGKKRTLSPRLRMMDYLHKIFPYVPLNELGQTYEYLDHSNDIHEALVKR